MIKLTIISLLLAATSGCSLFTEYVDKPYPVYTKINCDYELKIEGVHPLPVEPRVISDKNNNWWVAMSGQDYENLAINTQETIRYIKDQKGVIQYYRDCTSQFNDAVDEFNSVADGGY